MPFLVAGSDLICSGFGLDPEVRQLLQSLAPERRGARGLPRPPARLRGRRRPDPDRRGPGDGAPRPRARRASPPCSRSSASPARPPAMRASVAAASGSNDTESFTAGRRHPHQRGDPRPRHHGHRRRSARSPTRGFREEAENLLSLVRLRLSGDYLQTSALIRDGRVLSAVNDPNDYAGPRHRLPGRARSARGDRRHPRPARRARGAAQPGAVREGRGPPRPLHQRSARLRRAATRRRSWSASARPSASGCFKTLAGRGRVRHAARRSSRASGPPA